MTRNVSMTVGQQSVTFTEIEKIDRIIDATDSTAIRLLKEVSIHEIRSTQPTDDEPTRWALQNTDADSVVVLTDTVPQSAYSLQADGWTTLSELSGSGEPVFPESFHDILVWAVLSEELLKKEKEKLAATYALKAETLLKELRHHLADSPTRDTQQGGSSLAATSGASGGGGNTGGSIYTQTGLITFDRDPSAPFAVTASSAKVDNLDADKLDGLDSTAFALQSDFADHSARHESGGADAIKLDDLAAPDDNTDLNASTTAHGLAPKATAPASGLLSVLAIGNGATVRSDTPIFDTTNPAALGTAGPGSQLVAARRDHVHTLPKLDDLAAPDDNTDLNATTSAHGLLKKLSNTATEFMNGAGNWAVPAGGAVTLLTANSGTTTSTSAQTVDSVALSGLTAKDTLVVYFTAMSVTQGTAVMSLYHVTDAIAIGNIMATTITAGVTKIGQVNVMQRQDAATVYAGVAMTYINSGTADGTGFTVGVTTSWTGSWSLGFRHAGVTSGGTLKWTWSVYKLAGQ